MKKLLRYPIILGLTSLFAFYPIDNVIAKQEAKVEKDSGKITIEVKPVAGKVSCYSGTLEMEGFVMQGIKIGDLKMWMDINIDEEAIEDENCKLMIKQRLSKKGNYAYHWNWFISEKIDEIVEDSFKDGTSNLIYDITSFLPGKPVSWMEKWDNDIGVDFLRLSSNLFNYPIENIREKQLELVLLGLDKEKNKATIYFNMNDDMNNYNDKEIIIRNGNFFFSGTVNIEYEKKELIDVEMHLSYFFDGKIKGEDMFIRLISNFNLKNDGY